MDGFPMNPSSQDPILSGCREVAPSHQMKLVRVAINLSSI